MLTHVPGAALSVVFSLADADGAVAEPSAMRWRLLDEEQQELVAWTALALPEGFDGNVLVPVAPEHTQLPEGELRAMREVELEVSDDAGTRTLRELVLLQNTSALVVGVNSFCTYMRALMLSQDAAGNTMMGWERNSERGERERALVEAHTAIMQMPLYVRHRSLHDVLQEQGVTGLERRLLDALRMAQLLEASEILNADPTVMARRNGLLSMTVGESSQFFGTAKALDLPLLSRQALKMLGPWLSYSVRIGRA